MCCELLQESPEKIEMSIVENKIIQYPDPLLGLLMLWEGHRLCGLLQRSRPLPQPRPHSIRLHSTSSGQPGWARGA